MLSGRVVTGARRRCAAAGTPSPGPGWPADRWPSGIGPRGAGVKRSDRGAAGSEAGRSAHAPSRRKTCAPEAGRERHKNAGERHQKTRAEVTKPLPRAHLAHVGGQRVHPGAGRQGRVGVQHHLQGGNREEALLQILRRGQTPVKEVERM